MKKEYKITELIYDTKDCMADPTISEFYLEGEFKNVYRALYKWLRKQYCAVIAIDNVCTMYIGRLGDIEIIGNNKLLKIRSRNLIPK